MPKRNLILILAIVVAAIIAVFEARNASIFTGRGNWQPSTARSGHEEEFQPVNETYRLIKDRYLYPLEGQELRQGAVRGMVSSLDEYSTYVAPGRTGAFEQHLLGRERGLGLRVDVVDGQVTVLGPMAGSPALRAGIMAGDIIVAIDGKAAAGLGPEQMTALLDGPVGASVKLTLFRAPGPQTTLTLTREEFPIESVTGLYRHSSGTWVCVIDPASGIAYVRIREFVRDTTEQFQQLLRQLDRLQGLVLDLRGNPGGLLESSVGVSDLFLREGRIVSVVRRDGPPEEHMATPTGTYPDIPVVVLIDEGTASAAEIVAGALRLRGRAVLLGTRTCGKGCVQSMFKLPDDLGRINLTTSEFCLDSDEPISRRPGSPRWGVDPHEQIIILPSRQEKLARLRAAAEVLPLGRPTTLPLISPAGEGPPGMAEAMLRLDSPLERAVELLKKPREIEAILKAAEAERAARKARTAASDPRDKEGLQARP